MSAQELMISKLPQDYHRVTKLAAVRDSLSPRAATITHSNYQLIP